MTQPVWIQSPSPFSIPSLLSTFLVASIFWHLSLIKSVEFPSRLQNKRGRVTSKGEPCLKPTVLPHHLEGNEMPFQKSEEKKSYIQFGGSNTFKRPLISFCMDRDCLPPWTIKWKIRYGENSRAYRGRGQGMKPHQVSWDENVPVCAARRKTAFSLSPFTVDRKAMKATNERLTPVLKKRLLWFTLKNL